MEFSTFKPKNKTIVWTLNQDDCYWKKTGQCSLSLIKLEEVHGYKNLESNHIMRCPEIAKSIMENYKYEMHPITIQHYRCNHYTVDNGRHRVCIAGKLDLELKVVMQEIDAKCVCCARQGVINIFCKKLIKL